VLALTRFVSTSGLANTRVKYSGTANYRFLTDFVKYDFLGVVAQTSEGFQFHFSVNTTGVGALVFSASRPDRGEDSAVHATTRSAALSSLRIMEAMAQAITAVLNAVKEKNLPLNPASDPSGFWDWLSQLRVFRGCSGFGSKHEQSCVGYESNVLPQRAGKRTSECGQQTGESCRSDEAGAKTAPAQFGHGTWCPGVLYGKAAAHPRPQGFEASLERAAEPFCSAVRLRTCSATTARPRGFRNRDFLRRSSIHWGWYRGQHHRGASPCCCNFHTSRRRARSCSP